MKKIAAGVAAVLVLSVAGCSSDGSEPASTVTATATRNVTVTTTDVATVTARPTITRVVRTKTRTVVRKIYPTFDDYGDGLYVVGQDIQPGLYFTEGGDLCYWARLSSLNTSDIIDNQNTTGPTTVQVQSGDRAFQVTGDCTFGKR